MICIYLIFFVFSLGKENIPPIISTPRQSVDLSNEQTLSGII
jgi:hypothetical protein